jgi:hypothetical protein
LPFSNAQDEIALQGFDSPATRRMRLLSRRRVWLFWLDFSIWPAQRPSNRSTPIGQLLIGRTVAHAGLVTEDLRFLGMNSQSYAETGHEQKCRRIAIP